MGWQSALLTNDIPVGIRLPLAAVPVLASLKVHCLSCALFGILRSFNSVYQVWDRHVCMTWTKSRAESLH